MISFLSNLFDSIIKLTINLEFVSGVLLSGIIFFIIFRRKFSPDSIKINIPFGLGSANFITTPMERIIAWKLYIQLTTRKAALPFDEDFDLISDVYKSLFDLFRITRELLMELPPSEFKPDDGIATLMLRILNSGIRPHLTKWQVKFRTWYEANRNLEKYKNKSPQEIQRKFPGYKDLIIGLKKTNTELSKFADELKELSFKSKQERKRQTKIKPEAPENTKTQ